MNKKKQGVQNHSNATTLKCSFGYTFLLCKKTNTKEWCEFLDATKKVVLFLTKFVRDTLFEGANSEH
jgi:hypothetical protein